MTIKILGQMKDSDIDYSDVPATDAEFWQEATVEAARWMVSRETPIASRGNS
ncbi:hypothetical protein PN502_19955 [Microcystis aeruginosa CS-338/01]|uniref:hypothetical protein n=1 Tax=Microcystis aeruginosa TaxID=1126 RepID=UPI00232BD5DB|nr:hypothetical protein [Microcystis aeruginosa]MDB9509282.1 hypothetical protein [Microcystis aeruginosa CS-338/01]